MSKTIFDLTGKVAIITGGTKGIGLGIAKKLASQGANIVIASRTSSDCEKIAKEIESMGVKALGCSCDVSKLSDINNLYKSTIDKFGKVDIVVNNAGIASTSPAVNVTETDIDNLLNVNIKGVYFMCTEAAKIMQTQENKGCIINISSNAAFLGTPYLAAYATTKAAVVHLTKCLALEWAPHRIRVNSVAPGTVETDIFLSQPSLIEKIKQGIPFKELCTPEDIANAVLYLASDEAAMATGATMIVDGGRHTV